MDERDPRLTHETEQFQAAMRDLAPVLASFHARLIEEGLSRDEATELAKTLLQEVYREAQRG